MPGNALGAVKTAAVKVGISVSDYKSRIDAGMKHCTKCREWRASVEFGHDQSRHDGLAAKCIGCRRVTLHKVRRAFPFEHDKSLVQGAHDAIRWAIRRGEFPSPTSLRCATCWKPACQYHHLEGYEKMFWRVVQALCVSCHRKAHWEE